MNELVLFYEDLIDCFDRNCSDNEFQRLTNEMNLSANQTFGKRFIDNDQLAASFFS